MLVGTLTKFNKIIVVFDFYWTEAARIPKQNYRLIAFDPLVFTF